MPVNPYIPWDPLVPINRDVLPYGPDGIAFPFAYDYTWVFGLGIIVAFLAACGIGMNDVGNAFATSIGAKSLKLWQALVIAGIFEFLGAVLLGSQVAETIRKGIVDVTAFESSPDILMIGNLCALFSVAFWLFIATYWEMPVSTTHSTVGAVLGFGLCVPYASIDWLSIGGIVASWFVSPLLSGLCAVIFFLLLRTFILRHENSFQRVLIGFPLIVFVAVTLNVFFIIIKGGASLGWSDNLGGEAASFGVSCAVGAAVGLVIHFLVVPYMRKHLENVPDENPSGVDLEEQQQSQTYPEELTIQNDKPARIDISAGDCSSVSQSVDSTESPVPSKSTKNNKSRFKNWARAKDEKLHAIDADKHADVEAIHENAEKFERRTELAFGYLQMFTACCVAFAHGANDVANAIGPLAGIAAIYHTNSSSQSAEVPIWILVLGGAGIVVGLAVYGHKIIRALGVKLIKITPSRGASIELATATVVVVGSIYQLPLSTTQVMVGASFGVGLLEGGQKGVNTKLLAKVFSGWVLTLIVAGAVSAMLFSLIVYSPSISMQPLAPQNCMGAYGVTDPEQIIFTNATTALVGNIATGEFDILQ